MARVYIAEKPSLGRAIAAALPRPHKVCEGYIRAANGEIVTWCIGHLLEQVPPDQYDVRYKRWSLDDLPIVPAKWKLAPRPSARKQLGVIRKLLKGAPPLVHAGDPDREGQLLVDEVIDFLGYPREKRVSIERLLIRDMNPAAVSRALHKMTPNRDFAPLSVSALARSRADWLYGMNMSRAYTLLGQRSGYEGVLSVGRVQTPVLGLVVRRDDEIANFVSKLFFEVDALIPYRATEIKGRWKPSDACQAFLDEQGRVVHRALAENVVSRIENQPAKVVESVHKDTRNPAPLPYSLSSLQIDAAKRYGMTASAVLAACQALYERHKAITYPRSDCRYLPDEHFLQTPNVLSEISRNAASLVGATAQCDLSLRSRAWNSAKVSAHHAIVPTPGNLKKNSSNSNSSSSRNFSEAETKVYALIARQYLMQFYPPAVFSEGRLVFEIAGGSFIARSRTLREPGWRVLLGGKKSEVGGKAGAIVPALAIGTELVCRKGVISDKKTEPPKPFTEATLLEAMTGIARFVADAELRKVLRDTDGLGTEATRAGIIEGLLSRSLLFREGVKIHATPAGRGLVYALPKRASRPDMTAHWERQLADMAEGGDQYQPFMTALESRVGQLMEAAKQSEPPESLRGLQSPPRTKKKKRSARPSGKKRKAKKGSRREFQKNS